MQQTGDESDKLAAEVPFGATIRSTYLQREVTVYGIHEYEVETLSYLNSQSSVFFSAEPPHEPQASNNGDPLGGEYPVTLRFERFPDGKELVRWERIISPLEH
jgi:hypothetical protein